MSSYLLKISTGLPLLVLTKKISFLRVGVSPSFRIRFPLSGSHLVPASSALPAPGSSVASTLQLFNASTLQRFSARIRESRIASLICQSFLRFTSDNGFVGQALSPRRRLRAGGPLAIHWWQATSLRQGYDLASAPALQFFPVTDNRLRHSFV